MRAETPQEQFNLIGAGRRNRIINGDFKVSQRGTYSSATTITNWQYYVDRFGCYGQSNGAKLTHTDNSLKLEAFTTATNRMFVITKLETVDIQKNTTYTLSFYVTTNSSNFRVHVNDLSSPVLTYTSPSVVVPNGVRTKVSVPVTVGATVTTVFEIAIGLFASGRNNVAITSGDYFVLEEVQLELGKVATPFEHRSYGEELALCQRYFEKIDIHYSGIPVGLGQNFQNRKAIGPFIFKQEKRATPTIPSVVIGIDGGDGTHTFAFYATTTSCNGSSSSTSPTIYPADITETNFSIQASAEL